MVKLVFNNGTETGYTQTAAEIIQKEFGGDSLVALHDISQRMFEKGGQAVC